ncbi:MAG TPA: molybdopterin-dependent oxidoreductase, partial [Streptomyces sp.]|nr:molybdopterin-dependent oxidoreductase [Streptomyces sp.]
RWTYGWESSRPLSPAPRAASLGIPREAARGAGDRGRDDSHPYVHLDRDLCIACGRCVRMCSEVQGAFAHTLTGRGADTVVAPGTGGPWAESDCVACGGCVDTCPTGAITQPGPARGFTSRALPATGASTAGNRTARTARTRTTCGYCGVGCSLDVVTRDGTVTAVLPARDGPVNRGHACSKGRFAHGFLTSPERLTRPLVRRDGRLEPAGWNEALARVADGFRRAVAEGGPGAVAAISSARATNEENYLLQKFLRTVIGTNNIDNCSRLCHSPSAAGLTASFGLPGGTDGFDDVERADCLLIVGANPVEAHPVVGARLLARALRGARLVVADPRTVGLAVHADLHLRPRPGTNVALCHGIAHVLLAEGLADEEFLRERALGLEELRGVLADHPPERVARITGVPAGDIAGAARLYGRAERPAIVYGLGVTEHLHGTDGVRALANLAILRGAVGTGRGFGVNPLRGQNNVQGASDMGALPDTLPGYGKVTDPVARGRAEAVWGAAVPDRPGLRIPEMFAAARDGRLRALWVMGEDVRATDPDADRVTLALEPVDRIDVHPDDAARYGLRDGRPAVVDSRHGRARLTVRVTDETGPGQVFCAFHFPASGVNRLTSGHTDTVTSCPEYKVTAVRVVPAPHEERPGRAGTAPGRDVPRWEPEPNR